MKRNLINKASDIECRICNKMISSYNLTNHIKFNHGDWGVDKYVQEFGEFRKNKIPKKAIRKITKVSCEIPDCRKICSIVGMHNHLRDSHNGMTPDQYVSSGYSEYRPEKIRINNLLNEAGTDYRCLICHENCTCERVLTIHLKDAHDISKYDYILKYILFNEIPKCDCGCGQYVRIMNSRPYFRKFLSGHNGKGEKNGMHGKMHSENTRIKMKRRAALRDRSSQKISDTDIELTFKNFLYSNNIDFKSQIITEFGIIDFYLTDLDKFIEIDGSYWHPINAHEIPLKNASNLLSDMNKLNIENLIRIRDSNVTEIKTLEDLKIFNFKYDYSIDESTILFNKDDIKYHISILTKSQLSEKIANVSRIIQKLIELNEIQHFDFCIDYRKLKMNVHIMFEQINIDKIDNFTLSNLKMNWI